LQTRQFHRRTEPAGPAWLRPAGRRSENGAFYLTHAMGGGKTHSLIAFGLLEAILGLRREAVPNLASGNDFGAARVVIVNGHQNPDTLLWGDIADKLGRGDIMAPFWRNGAKVPGINEWTALLGNEPVLILLDELPSYLQIAQGQLVGVTNLADLTIGALGAPVERPAAVPPRLRRCHQPKGRRVSRRLRPAAHPHRQSGQAVRSQRHGDHTGAVEHREIYEIVRKHLFDGLPPPERIDRCALRSGCRRHRRTRLRTRDSAPQATDRPRLVRAMAKTSVLSSRFKFNLMTIWSQTSSQPFRQAVVRAVLPHCEAIFGVIHTRP